MIESSHHCGRTSRARQRRIAISALALLTGLTASTVTLAQTKGDDFKNPPREFLDPLGVDISGGAYIRHDTFLSIGDAGMAWSFHAHNPVLSGDFRGYIGDSCTNPPPVFSQPSCGEDPGTMVWVGESATEFEPGTGGTFVNYGGSAATLTVVSGNYIYTTDDGTIYTFVPLTSGAATGSGTYLSTIKHPNGNLITLNGQFTGTCTSGSTNCEYNYVSAVSNTGYALVFDNSANLIKAVNMSAHTCDTQALSCAAYDASITITPSVTDADLTGFGNVQQITDPMGNSWKYRVGRRYSYTDPLSNEIVKGAKVLWSMKDPTGVLVRTTRATRGGLTGLTLGSSAQPSAVSFTYAGQGTYADPGDSYTNTTRDSSGALMYTAEMGGSNGTMSFMTDALSHTTSYNIAAYQYGYTSSGTPIAQYTRLISVTKPEGDYVTYTYDSRGNVTSAVKTGKSGSGITVSYAADFPSTCTNAITCNKPTATRDALSNQTDYTYDATHGGVLTVTGPADSSATPLRQRTYNTYTADTFGANTLYRLTRTETCGLTTAQLTLTACPAAVTTSVTTTTYLGHTFQVASTTQTDGAGTLSATTSQLYDYVGNVTVTDGPRTDVDDRSYKTYDAARRVVYEAGPIPSTGLKRTVVHHVYDAAGREIRTEKGYENNSVTDGSDFVTVSGSFANSNNTAAGASFIVTSFSRMTFDVAGRLIKTEAVQP